jgi:hypothetical protein
LYRGEYKNDFNEERIIYYHGDNNWLIFEADRKKDFKEWNDNFTLENRDKYEGVFKNDYIKIRGIIYYNNVYRYKGELNKDEF